MTFNRMVAGSSPADGKQIAFLEPKKHKKQGEETKGQSNRHLFFRVVFTKAIVAQMCQSV